MKKIVAYIAILCLIITLLSGCSNKEIEKPNTVTNVTVHKISANDINSEVNYTGEIKALEESDVAPKVTATIRSFNCELGDFVNVGDVLAILDDTDYQIAYNQALAAYNTAYGSFKQMTLQLSTAISTAQIEYDNALLNYNRQKALYDAGAISQLALEGAETRLNTAELNLNSAKTNYDIAITSTYATAKASVDSAKAVLESATNNLNNTVITAPISGYVASKNGTLGQIVAAGNPMFSIKSTDVVNVEISVTESVIPYINIGTKASVSVSTASLNDIKGEVTVVNTVKNVQTGMYTVKIKIDNNDNLLKLGMMADVVIETQAKSGVIVIPSASIMQDDEGYSVYIVKDNKAEKRTITIGITNNDFTEVITGLSAGETVVVSGKEYLSKENNAVNIVEE